jgi:hypothetical protein
MKIFYILTIAQINPDEPRFDLPTVYAFETKGAAMESAAMYIHKSIEWLDRTECPDPFWVNAENLLIHDDIEGAIDSWNASQEEEVIEVYSVPVSVNVNKNIFKSYAD